MSVVSDLGLLCLLIQVFDPSLMSAVSDLGLLCLLIQVFDPSLMSAVSDLGLLCLLIQVFDPSLMSAVSDLSLLCVSIQVFDPSLMSAVWDLGLLCLLTGDDVVQFSVLCSQFSNLHVIPCARLSQSLCVHVLQYVCIYLHLSYDRRISALIQHLRMGCYDLATGCYH